LNKYRLRRINLINLIKVKLYSRYIMIKIDFDKLNVFNKTPSKKKRKEK